MGLDPSLARTTASGPAGSERPGRDSSGDWAGPEITRVEVLPLREGDRLIVHVGGAAGMSAGGAHRIAELIQDGLKLGELGFDVPVIVVSPGIRVEVARPT